MRITFEIFRFEFLEQRRYGANYLFFAVLGFLSFIVTAFLGSSFQSFLGFAVPVLVNSSFVIALITWLLTLIGLLGISGGLFGSAATKDFDTNFAGLLVTSGVSEHQYILGRLLATWLTGAIVLLSMPLGMLLGLTLPSNIPEQLAPFRLASYLESYLCYSLPNLILFGAVFFATGLLLRRSIWVYISGFALPTLANLLLTPLEWVGLKSVSQALDITGGLEIGRAMWWTVIERNTRILPISGEFLAGRAFWLLLTAAGIWALCRAFKFSQPPLNLAELPILRRFNRRKPQTAPDTATAGKAAGAAPHLETLAPATTQPAPSISLQRSFWAHLRQLAARVRFEFDQIAGNRWFWIALAAAAVFAIAASVRGLDAEYGVSSYPTTARLLENNGAFTTIVTLFLIFLLGESLWRERDAGIDGLVDTTSAPNAVFLLGKLLAVCAVQVLALGIFILACMLVQTLQGYFNYEPGLYLQRIFTIDLVRSLLFISLALFVQVLINNKFIGHFFNFLLFFAIPMLQNLPRSAFPRLALYAYTPLPIYSDMNGFGHFLDGVRWFQAYWGLLAAILILISLALAPRGVEGGFRSRLHQAGTQLRHGPLGGLLLLSGGLFLLCGGWIFYNTQVLYQSPQQALEQEFAGQSSAAAEEEAIKAYLEKYAPFAAAQPQLTAIVLDVDIFPNRQEMTAQVRYQLENKTAGSLSELLLNDRTAEALSDFTLDGQPLEGEMERVAGYRVHRLRLPQPLLPGAQASLGFSYHHLPSAGFADEVQDYAYVENGSLIASDTFLPQTGYLDYLKEALPRPVGEQPQTTAEPSAGADKTHSDLAEVDYLAAGLATGQELEAARQRPAFGLGGHAVRLPLAGRICTDAGQTAFLPGKLVAEDTAEAGRHCFSYRSETPLVTQFFIVSGRYERLAQEHAGNLLEIFYHPAHAENLASLMDAMKTALDINGAAYNPYPFGQLRIVEIPAYTGAAISTPGTIVFGEQMGMYSKIDRQQPGVVDFPFFVAAHETSHQWWGEQLIPARAEGLHVILESLTQYSAVKAIDAHYGVESVRSFLAFELKKYIEGRLSGTEAPLAQVKGARDDYVYYRKGAVVMYTLRDALGAQALDGSLRAFMQNYAEGPPYPLSGDLMDYLRRAAAAKDQQVITDLLETITLWDLNTDKAAYTPRADGRYDVTLQITAHKVRSDALGNETEVEMQEEMIDIGVLDAGGRFIFLEKRPLSSGENVLTLIVPELPLQAGVDPVNKLIDRASGNNLIAVSEAK